MGAPGKTGDVEARNGCPPGRADSTIRITDVTRPTISVYRPSPAKDTGTAVLVCPGGGYSRLAYNKEGTEVAEWLNSLGITGIVLKYRVPARKDRPRHQAPLQDAQAAPSGSSGPRARNGTSIPAASGSWASPQAATSRPPCATTRVGLTSRSMPRTGCVPAGLLPADLPRLPG